MYPEFAASLIREEEIPLSEQLKAGERLSDLVDAVFETYAPYEPETRENQALHFNLDIGTMQCDVVVGRAPYNPDETKYVHFTHLIDGILEGDSVEYNLASDGIVRRDTTIDVGIMQERQRFHEKRHPALYIIASNGSMTLEQQDREAALNKDLEIEMGVNNLPVGLYEIGRVIDWVGFSKHVPEEAV